MDQKQFTSGTLPPGAQIGAAIYGEEWQAKLRWQRESADQSNRQRALEMAMETLRRSDGRQGGAGEILDLAGRYYDFIVGPQVMAAVQPIAVTQPRTERAPGDPDGLAV